MKTRRRPKETPTPHIVTGARILAALSVIWSGYAISDLMHSGIWGVTVAISGDIGWITVLWAEANRVRIAGRTWPATAAGWLIAAGVGILLAVHGAQGPNGSWAQGMAGVLVIAVSKVVWLFALAATTDPAALTPEQEAEIHRVMRESEYVARLQRARSDGEIARIEEEARATLARDEADFQIVLERIRKRAEIDRRTPFTSSLANTNSEPSMLANTVSSSVEQVREQIANTAATSPNPANAEPSMADLVREHVANTTDNRAAVDAVMAAKPDANRASVAAAVRRERRNTQGYA